MKLYAITTSDKGGADAKKGGDEIVQVFLYRGNKKVGYVQLTADNLNFTEYKGERRKDKIRMCGACATNPKYKDLYTQCEHYKGE